MKNSLLYYTPAREREREKNQPEQQNCSETFSSIPPERHDTGDEEEEEVSEAKIKGKLLSRQI